MMGLFAWINQRHHHFTFTHLLHPVANDHRIYRVPRPAGGYGIEGIFDEGSEGCPPSLRPNGCIVPFAQSPKRIARERLIVWVVGNSFTLQR